MGFTVQTLKHGLETVEKHHWSLTRNSAKDPIWELFSLAEDQKGLDTM